MTTPELAAILSLFAFVGWFMLWCFALGRASSPCIFLARVYEIWRRFFRDSQRSDIALVVMLLLPAIVLPATAIAYIAYTVTLHTTL